MFFPIPIPVPVDYDINFDVDVDVTKDVNLVYKTTVDLDGWTADAGADAEADAGNYSYYTNAEAYTEAYVEVGYSEASSYSSAAIDYFIY